MQRILRTTTRVCLWLGGIVLCLALLFVIGGYVWDRTYNNLDDIESPSIEELASEGIQTIDANGLSFAYIAEGNPSNPLILLVHGFPDTAHTYEQVLPHLADEGYYAVAYFQRGYYPTEIPEDDDYAAYTLGQDALALISAFGKESAVLIGHDWGASAVYAAATLDPTKVEKLVVVAIPHPRVIEPNIETFQRAPHFIQLQFGFISEWLTRRHDFVYLEELLAYWAPNWEMPEAELDRIKRDFSRPGRLKAALGYYRSFFQDAGNNERLELYQQKTTVPTLAFAGQEDGPLDISLFENMDLAFTQEYQFVSVPVAGHFVHQETPKLFVDEIIAFLNQEAAADNPP